MAVFSRNMDEINVAELAQSMGKLRDYIDYMQECVEFSIGKLSRENKVLADKIKALESAQGV